ncbi:MAG TPA: hypothetical protein DCY07_02965 [Rhodospirillaceae bacterium]|nr:hypothetical protein [Rhodospirillaceae bacterium]
MPQFLLIFEASLKQQATITVNDQGFFDRPFALIVPPDNGGGADSHIYFTANNLFLVRSFQYGAAPRIFIVNTPRKADVYEKFGTEKKGGMLEVMGFPATISGTLLRLGGVRAFWSCDPHQTWRYPLLVQGRGAPRQPFIDALADFIGQGVRGCDFCHKTLSRVVAPYCELSRDGRHYLYHPKIKPH